MSQPPAWHVEAQRLAPVLESIGRREMKRRAEREAAAPPRTGKLFPPPFVLPDPATIPNRWESLLELAERDPAAAVDRLHARDIGWRLYAMGDVDAMRDCLDLIESGAALSYVDAAWDGIGAPGGGTWWR